MRRPEYTARHDDRNGRKKCYDTKKRPEDAGSGEPAPATGKCGVACPLPGSIDVLGPPTAHTRVCPGCKPAAYDVVNHPKAREEGLKVRAGLGYGQALAINGDYFGITVNLAARLVAAAGPGQILASQAVCDELPDWVATAMDPLTLKGFDAPVTAYELHGGC